MLRLLGLMISIGLVDSLNPSTIAPALYLATAEHPRRRVAEFTLAVFVVYLGGGVLIALGPGELVQDALPKGHLTVRHVAEILAGAILIVASLLVYRERERIAGRGLPQPRRRRSSAVLGATITAVELPTAFPYFAAIAAVVGGGVGVPRELGLLLVFNACFVLPLVGILVILTVAGPRSERLLTAGRNFLERRWPDILAILLALVGILAILLGATGLAGGRLACGYRHLLAIKANCA